MHRQYDFELVWNYFNPRRMNLTNMALLRIHQLVHKDVKIKVDEWILESTRPQKNAKISESQKF